MFNSKKIEELERRIAALEPKPSPNLYAYVTSTSTATNKPTVESLDERIKAVEEEVGIGTDGGNHRSIFSFFYDDKPEKLTLKRKVDRLLAHLKLSFVIEPQRTVIKPVKPSRR